MKPFLFSFLTLEKLFLADRLTILMIVQYLSGKRIKLYDLLLSVFVLVVGNILFIIYLGQVDV